MNRKARLIAELAALPREMKFSDVARLPTDHGFELRRTSGSHHLFSDGETTLSIPAQSGRTVKRTYLVQIVAALGLTGEPE